MRPRPEDSETTDKMSIAAITGPKIKYFDGEYIKVQVSSALQKL
jgi:hypothetical protein